MRLADAGQTSNELTLEAFVRINLARREVGDRKSMEVVVHGLGTIHS